MTKLGRQADIEKFLSVCEKGKQTYVCSKPYFKVFTNRTEILPRKIELILVKSDPSIIRKIFDEKLVVKK